MRLAMRVEGYDWVAYCAPIDSMEGAQEMARIRIGAVEKHRELREGFLDLMKRMLELAVGDVMKGASIESWGEETLAPESERSGSA